MGGAIAIGLLLAAAALAFGGSGGSSSASNDCGRVVVSPDKVMPNLDRIAALATAMPPSSRGVDFLSKAMKIMFPQCAWSETTKATIVGANGVEIEWQMLVETMGDRTVGELNTDPEFIALINGGKQGSDPSPSATRSLGRFSGVAP